MGMTEDFEASLQVLRGFDTDISIEVNEIKVKAADLTFLNCTSGELMCPFSHMHFHLEKHCTTTVPSAWKITYLNSYCGMHYAEICSINDQKNNNSVCRTQTEKILVPFDGTKHFPEDLVLLPVCVWCIKLGVHI